jgi:hypothetical protein
MLNVVSHKKSGSHLQCFESFFDFGNKLLKFYDFICRNYRALGTSGKITHKKGLIDISPCYDRTGSEEKVLRSEKALKKFLVYASCEICLGARKTLLSRA